MSADVAPSLELSATWRTPCRPSLSLQLTWPTRRSILRGWRN